MSIDERTRIDEYVLEADKLIRGRKFPEFLDYYQSIKGLFEEEQLELDENLFLRLIGQMRREGAMEERPKRAFEVYKFYSIIPLLSIHHINSKLGYLVELINR